MAVTVYQYPKCSTCRKALAFLKARGVAYQAIDIVEHPPSRAAIEALWKRSGLPLRKLFNTSGVSYREGRFGERLGTMTDAEALDALAADGKLIKRPLVEGPGFVLVGFDEAAYARHF
jgi:arsenate reductase